MHWSMRRHTSLNSCTCFWSNMEKTLLVARWAFFLDFFYERGESFISVARFNRDLSMNKVRWECLSVKRMLEIIWRVWGNESRTRENHWEVSRERNGTCARNDPLRDVQWNEMDQTGENLHRLSKKKQETIDFKSFQQWLKEESPRRCFFFFSSA